MKRDKHKEHCYRNPSETISKNLSVTIPKINLKTKTGPTYDPISLLINKKVNTATMQSDKIKDMIKNTNFGQIIANITERNRSYQDTTMDPVQNSSKKIITMGQASNSTQNHKNHIDSVSNANGTFIEKITIEENRIHKNDNNIKQEGLKGKQNQINTIFQQREKVCNYNLDIEISEGKQDHLSTIKNHLAYESTQKATIDPQTKNYDPFTKETDHHILKLNKHRQQHIFREHSKTNPITPTMNIAQSDGKSHNSTIESKHNPKLATVDTDLNLDYIALNWDHIAALQTTNGQAKCTTLLLDSKKDNAHGEAKPQPGGSERKTAHIESDSHLTCMLRETSAMRNAYSVPESRAHLMPENSNQTNGIQNIMNTKKLIPAIINSNNIPQVDHETLNPKKTKEKRWL